jgi:hypothetical protein
MESAYCMIIELKYLDRLMVLLYGTLQIRYPEGKFNNYQVGKVRHENYFGKYRGSSFNS